MRKFRILESVYKIYNRTLTFSSNNEFILQSVESYFSVYKNLHKFRSSETVKIELFDDNFDNSKINKIKSRTIKTKPAAEHKKRFTVHRINKNIYAAIFYNGLAKINIDVKQSYIYGYIEKPERFGLDFIPNFIIIALLEILFKFKNIFFIHSSAVANKRGAIIFAGASGSGKSTLAFYLMSKKFNLISDDKCFAYEKNGVIEVSGLLQPIDIIKKKDDYLIGLGLIEKIFNKYNENEKRYVVSEFKKNNIEYSGIVKSLIFPKTGDSFEVKRLTKNEALTRLLKHSVTPGMNISLKQHFEILYKIIENSDCYSMIVSKDLNEFYKFIKGITK
ncbi:MAG TPA: hypothetical protein PKY81_02140 [bacterium]|nr:hypothetical protein [bacterium]HPN29735.1 hypothetical protein [bacterium]